MKDYRTWYQKYRDDYENIVTNLPVNGHIILNTENWEWSEIYFVREQLWAEREGLC